MGKGNQNVTIPPMTERVPRLIKVHFNNITIRLNTVVCKIYVTLGKYP